nr:type II toxin-antitoxin system HipA family toxin [Eubacterium sp.]
HQMLINGKNENITYDDLIISGKNMGISSVKCKKIINDINKVLENIESNFERAGVGEKSFSKIIKIINEQK